MRGEHRRDAERGAGGDEDAGEADWATYQAQSRQCTSHSVVSVLLYARHGIIIINPGQHTQYSRAGIYILVPDTRDKAKEGFSRTLRSRVRAAF